MRGSLLVTFDEEVNNRGFDIIQVTVNGVIRKIIPNDSVNQYSTYVNTGDVVTIGITSNTSYPGLTKQCAVNRLDYTTDDTGGDFGIKNTAVQSTSGTTQFFTATFTATTRPDAYTFHYVVDCLSEVPCYNIGSGYTHTTLLQPAVRDIKLKGDLVYTVGNFNRYNGIPQSGLTVTNLNGSLYTGFTNLGCQVTIQPTSVEVLSDGKIYVTTDGYGGVGTNGLVRINTNGTRDTSFSGLTSNDGGFYDIEIQGDGKIICGGVFNSINGTSRQNICRLNTNGSLDTSFGGVSGFTSTQAVLVEVNDIDILLDGKILCVGGFNKYSGVTRNSICRLNSDGTLDTSFTSPFTGPIAGANIYTLTVQELTDGKILVGGELQIGTTTYGLVRLNSDGTLDTTFPYYGVSDRVNDIEQQLDGKILISTYNTSTPSAISRLFRINSDGSIDSSFNQLTYSDNNLLTTEVIAIDETRDLYYFGGGFETLNGQSYNHFVSGFLYNGDLNMCS
jgi:uncharacterized delta-60 repeat protein